MDVQLRQDQPHEWEQGLASLQGANENFVFNIEPRHVFVYADSWSKGKDANACHWHVAKHLPLHVPQRQEERWLLAAELCGRALQLEEAGLVLKAAQTLCKRHCKHGRYHEHIARTDDWIGVVPVKESTGAPRDLSHTSISRDCTIHRTLQTRQQLQRALLSTLAHQMIAPFAVCAQRWKL